MNITNRIYHDPEAARKHLEATRWEDGRFCPHCGETENTSPVESKNHRPGLYYCNSCRKTFTITVGTLFERSKVPLHKWLLANHLIVSSKKGISAHQLHRMLGVTYKTAWFMAHRIREAMRDFNPDPIGGKNKVVEADETFIGGKARNAKKGKPMCQRLAAEILDAYKGEGTAVTTRENVHRMAEANKAFAHFAW